MAKRDFENNDTFWMKDGLDWVCSIRLDKDRWTGEKDWTDEQVSATIDSFGEDEEWAWSRGDEHLEASFLDA